MRSAPAFGRLDEAPRADRGFCVPDCAFERQELRGGNMLAS
jgi:hypothetical protein